MRGALLTRKPDTPKTRRVRFDAPADLVDRTTALIATAKQHGFDLSLNEALVDAYARIAAKLRAELDAALGAPLGAGAAPGDGAPGNNGDGDARDQDAAPHPAHPDLGDAA